MQGKGVVRASFPSSCLRDPSVRAPVLGITVAASLPASPLSSPPLLATPSAAAAAAVGSEAVCAGGLGLGVLPPLGRRVRGVSEGSMAEAVVLSLSESELRSRARARGTVGGLGREEEGMLCGGGGVGWEKVEGGGCGLVEGGGFGGCLECGLGRGFSTRLWVRL